MQSRVREACADSWLFTGTDAVGCLGSCSSCRLSSRAQDIKWGDSVQLQGHNCTCTQLRLTEQEETLGYGCTMHAGGAMSCEDLSAVLVATLRRPPSAGRIFQVCC